MFDVAKVLDALQNDPSTRKTAMTGAAAGAAGLAGGMLMGKSGRKLLGKTAKYGALAALGGLAYYAWQRHSAKPEQGPAGSAQPDYEAAPEGAFLPAPEDEAAQDALGQALVRAMIAAAKADGQIDGDEKARIFARLETLDLDAGSKAFVFDELSAPLDINAVVAGADTPEHAAEIYAASLVAIDGEDPAQKAYLQMLAARLALDEGLVEEIHVAARAQAV